MEQAALVLSITALLLSFLTFWYLQARRGTLTVGEPRTFAFAATTNTVVMQLPLIFMNDGPLGYVVRNLRVRVQNLDPSRPLAFIATVEKLGTDEGRAFATAILVPGNQTVMTICQFQREPGEENPAPREMELVLDARLDNRQEWKEVLGFKIRARASAGGWATAFTVFDNEATT